MKTLVFGSLNLDYVYTVDHIVCPGETIASSKVETYPGGKGLNQAIAISKAGLDVYLAGSIGSDGTMLVDISHEFGVDTRFVRTVEGRSGHAIIQVDSRGQNCILLFGGANQKNDIKYVDEVLSFFTKGDIILVQNEINEIEYILKSAKSKEMITVLNPSPIDELIVSPKITTLVDVFILNEIECEAILKVADHNKMADLMIKQFPSSEVLITLGEQGSIYISNSESYKQKAQPVCAVDTTAAGDTFTGYFLAGKVKRDTIPDTMKKASIASAISVTKQGAAKSIPFLEEVNKVFYAGVKEVQE
jgi:ribokinase